MVSGLRSGGVSSVILSIIGRGNQSSYFFCNHRGKAWHQFLNDHLVYVDAARHDAEPSAKPERRAGYRRIYNENEKIAAKFLIALV